MSFSHTSVLLEETVAALHPTDGAVYVDCTLGGGGHTEALLEAADCTVYGIDRDGIALAAASERLQRFGDRFVPLRGRFSDLEMLLDQCGAGFVDGVMADLGVSSPQLDDAERGFSFMRRGPIDMRMDQSAECDGAQVVNEWREEELARILRDYGEERKWRRVARTLVEGRPWTDTLHLANGIAAVVGRGKGKKNPATRSFQAIRIAVNDELGEVERLLPAVVQRLAPGGRLAIISFHSLEDRLVKRFLASESGKNAERDPYGNPIGTFRLSPPGKSVTPSPSDPNPRARSARLRTASRLPWTQER